MGTALKREKEIPWRFILWGISGFVTANREGLDRFHPVNLSPFLSWKTSNVDSPFCFCKSVTTDTVSYTVWPTLSFWSSRHPSGTKLDCSFLAKRLVTRLTASSLLRITCVYRSFPTPHVFSSVPAKDFTTMTRPNSCGNLPDHVDRYLSRRSSPFSFLEVCSSSLLQTDLKT